MKSKFQTYNKKKQHLNIEAHNFPLLSVHLDSIDAGQIKSNTTIRLSYAEFKPLADEYAKETKLSGEPNYIPVVIKANGCLINITYE